MAKTGKLVVCSKCGRRFRRFDRGIKCRECKNETTRQWFKANPLKRIWYNMISRCTNPNAVNYRYYGEKGISVCDEWLDYDSFERFAVHNGYAEGLTVNRIDSLGDYEPSNVNFITPTENNRMKRGTKLTYKKVAQIRNSPLPSKILAQKFGVTSSTINLVRSGKTWKVA